MRLLFAITILVAILDIASMGRAGGLIEAGTSAHKDRLILVEAAVGQPALRPTSHPGPPPPGGKTLAALSPARGLTPALGAEFAALPALQNAHPRSACRGVRAARAPPAARS